MSNVTRVRSIVALVVSLVFYFSRLFWYV